VPLYEYSCQKCSREIELLVRGDKTPVCPHCRSTKLTKLLSVVSGHVAGVQKAMHCGWLKPLMPVHKCFPELLRAGHRVVVGAIDHPKRGHAWLKRLEELSRVAHWHDLIV